MSIQICAESIQNFAGKLIIVPVLGIEFQHIFTEEIIAFLQYAKNMTTLYSIQIVMHEILNNITGIQLLLDLEERFLCTIWDVMLINTKIVG